MLSKIQNGYIDGDEFLDECWTDALKQWSHALQFTYQILTITPISKQRAFGEWFLSEGIWCVQLEGSNVAQFDALRCDESVRKALSWTLQTMRGMQNHSNRALYDVLLDLADAPVDKLREACNRHETDGNLNVALPHEPGYFLWIRLDVDMNQSYFLSDRLENGIDAIIEAFESEGWHLWFSYKRDWDSILLFQPLSSLAQMNEHLPDDLCVGEDELGIEYQSISLYARSLAAMLESDAMVVPTIFVSQKMQSKADVYPAIATLALIHQRHAQNLASSRLSIFADGQLEYWISLLPDNVQSLFLKWVLCNTEYKAITLQKELSDVLEGLLAANLNVSEAARTLYLHRNTLVNRIDRIKQLTGFDIRNFFEAATLWMILKMTSKS